MINIRNMNVFSSKYICDIFYSVLFCFVVVLFLLLLQFSIDLSSDSIWFDWIWFGLYLYGFVVFAECTIQAASISKTDDLRKWKIKISWNPYKFWFFVILSIWMKYMNKKIFLKRIHATDALSTYLNYSNGKSNCTQNSWLRAQVCE